MAVLLAGCAHLQHQTSESEPHGLVTVVKTLDSPDELGVVQSLDGLPVSAGRGYRVRPGVHTVIVRFVETVIETSKPLSYGIGTPTEKPATVHVSEAGRTSVTGQQPFSGMQPVNLSVESRHIRYITNSISVQAGGRYELEGERMTSLVLPGAHAQPGEQARNTFADTRAKAEKGDAQAQQNLGFWYKTGQGVAKDEVEAVKWFRKAADQSNAMAQYNLGVSYLYGQGVAKNEVEAVKWYRQAAGQNLADAQHSLSICYFTGEGVARDDMEAVTWLRRSADQGFAPAQGDLGIRYATGQGVAKDEVEGAKWLHKAAEQNNAKAQGNLGLCYVLARGVREGKVEAYMWFLLAAAQGDQTAKNNLAKLEGIMSPEQRAAGKRRADDWLEQRKNSSTNSRELP